MIKTKILLRLMLLLFLIMTGVNGVWGQIFYNQNYETATDVSLWTTQYASLSLETGDATYGKYIKISQGGGSGPRSAYTRFFTSGNNFYSDINLYSIEFDAAIRYAEGNYDANAIVLYGEGAAMPNSNALFSNSNYLFKVFGGNNSGTTYTVDGDNRSTTFTNEAWYHYKIDVDKTSRTITYNISQGGSVILSNNYTASNAVNMNLQGIVVDLGRANSYVSIDNIKVYHVGWSASSFTKDITTVNYQNKLDGMPRLYDASGADITGSATFTWPAMVGAGWDDSYPPRLQATGSGTVTASAGGNSYSYTLNVTGTNVTGTYDASTNKYTFNTVGIITQRTFTDVQGITMTINGGPTAMVVNAEGTTALKVIDEGGYSQPNLSGGAVIPWEGVRGGTFYIFDTTSGGILYIEGNCWGASLYKSDGTAVMTGFWSTKTFHLDEGTYYLYNPNDVPLLHSYRFVSDDKTSLKFKNPSSTISVDLSEGSYTNEAVSGLGLPITYSILAGGSYATINSATGKVTFKKSELLNQTFPLTITVMAHTDAWSTYPEATATYNLQLTKTSWIFNDNDMWATTGSDLNTIWGGRTNNIHNFTDGTYHYQLTRRLTNEALTSDGTNELPETKGLRFTTDNATNRLEIAPHGESPNYLTVLNTTIYVLDVKAGQTVTVDWYATRSSAKLTMTDAADVSTGELGQGISSLTATANGTMQLYFNSTAAYIRSIKVSSPIRATGTLTYAKTIMNPGETEMRTGYTIVNEETGIDIKDAYHGPGNFKSSNTDVATVDASGNVTAVSEGVVFITATAAPKNSSTHQTATLTTMIEVTNASALNSAQTRTRTIYVEKLLYEVGEYGKSANDGLNRTIPGFTLTFEGGQGVKCNSEEKLTLRNYSGSQGVMHLSTRMAPGKFAGIGKVRLTVTNLSGDPQVTYNRSGSTYTQAVTNGVLELDGIYGEAVHITAIQGSFDISDIKIYYGGEAASIDNCLDETKVAPNFGFATQHYMRVPGDGRAFQNDMPTSSDPKNFRASEFTYTSSNTGIATISSDGTGGHLISSGEATITATFDETDYFAQSTATYMVSNTLLPGESYDGLAMTTGQFIHVTAEASADNTTLTMENAATNLTFGTTRERRNSYVNSATNVNLKNETSENITIYSVDIITSNVKAWLYYEGQEENYSAQVQFTGFPTGPIVGFKVVDFGDINNPIDITDAYSYTSGNSFAIQGDPSGYALLNPGGATTETWYSGTGDANTPEAGTAERTSEIRRGLTKTGSADGYDETLIARSTVTVMQFDATHPVVWNFQNQLDNTGVSGQMGEQWSYTNPGTDREKYYQTYFDSFMPILKNGEVAKDNNVGVLVNGDMRYYCGTSGLRLNLTKANAHIKFPVKEGMEVVVQLATSAADVTNLIHNTNSVKPPYNKDSLLYVQREGVNSPINAYYLAASNGAVVFDALDKVGVYIKSITLQVPELHFTDEIVTELAGSASRTVNYKPYNAIEGHTLNYWVKDNWNHYLDDTGADVGYVATIPDADRTTGDVTLTGFGHEGWVTIYVEDPSATGVQPKKGEYKLYVVNFQFEPNTDAISLDANGEAVFNRRPIGYDKVKTPIEYSMSLGTEDSRGRLIQYTNEDPAQTTYQMTAYSTGSIIVKAKSGNAETTCTVTISGSSFQYVAPVISEGELKMSSPQYSFVNTLPDGWNASNTTITCDWTGDITGCNAAIDGTSVKLTNISGYGAIRIVATNGSATARFVLTVAYPASSLKKWRFFRTNGLKIGIIDTYNDYNNAKQNIAKTIVGTQGWTTESSWSQIFRKGAELPRWGNDRSLKGDNAFYVEETAGLQIETGNRGFYVDQPATDPTQVPYNHIGLHNNASITIPKLKDGEFVSLNLSRVIPNNGAILRGYNVTDLRGKEVNESFTISRSQTEYPDPNDKTKMATTDGKRFIPGFYTFIAKDLRAADNPDKIAHPNEFNVTFELVDEGYLDVLSVEIYDGGRYKHTMTEVKLKNQDVMAPNIMLKDENEEQQLRLEFCHPLWSTSTGPAEYVFKGEQVDVTETYSDPTACRYWVDAATTQKLKDDRKNLELTLKHDKWFSDGGVEYEDGLLTIKKGYGKVVLRMNNYTVEGRYLIGYTPDYVLNVGVIPHQVYPHTWNFTNISGGEVKGQTDNVYNSIKNDGSNWIKIANVGDVYQLNTDSRGASLYVPGGELVSTSRILGQKGEQGNTDRGQTAGSFTPTETSTPRGYDELSGLGVNGKILFSVNTTATAPQGFEFNTQSSRRAAGDENDLLTYSIQSTGFSSDTNLTAGNGTINFGANKFETSSVSSTGYTYKCDGGNTKYIILTPQRSFEAGDVIQIKAWSNNENGGLAFWTDRTDAAQPVKLVTLSLTKTNEEDVLEYTVTVDDGIEGLSHIYVYNNGLTSYFNAVTITRSTVPTTMRHNLFTATETTLTIPDLNANGKQDWIYISADNEPTAVTNATKVYEENDDDGPDANTANMVYKYKVTNAGNSDITFADGTNIYQIGVTHILKDIHDVGGVGWATESRRHSIDHTLTGFFTVNDANAYTVGYDSYDLNTATVALSRVEDGMGVPAKAGVVLRIDQTTNLSQANLNSVNDLRRVPLFYPAVSTAIIPYEDMRFKEDGNMMMANLEQRNMAHEQESGTLDDNADDVDDTGQKEGNYTRFLLTNIHWTYNSSHTLNADEAADYQEANAAGFYRMHIWETTDDKDTKNILAENTAYMLVPTTQLPIAVWTNQTKASGTPVMNTIGIRFDDTTGIKDIDVPNDDGQVNDCGSDCWYTLNGLKLTKKPEVPGLYIHGGRKVIVTR